MDNIVRCDHCGKEFEMKILEKDQELYFICDHCDYKYNVSYTNDQIEKYQQEIQDLINQNNKRIKAIEIQVKKETSFNQQANVKPLVNKGNKLIKKTNKKIRAIQSKIKTEIDGIKLQKANQ